MGSRKTGVISKMLDLFRKLRQEPKRAEPQLEHPKKILAENEPVDDVETAMIMMGSDYPPTLMLGLNRMHSKKNNQ